MKKTKQIIIIRGTSGSGKSTIATKIAVELKAVLLHTDVFHFEMLPYRPENKEHFNLGNDFIELCLNSAMKKEKVIILEGALVTTNRRVNEFDISNILKIAKKYKYTVNLFKFSTSHDVAVKRMKARNNIVPEAVYKKLEKALQKSVVDQEHLIGTGELTEEETLKEVYKILNKKQ